MVDFWQSLVDFSGVIAGVLLAFEFDRWRERQTRKSEAIEFLTLISDELNENLHTLTQVRDEFRAQAYMPYFGLRTGIWSGLLTRITLVKNDTLRGRILVAYAKFDMYERTLVRYLDLCYILVIEPSDLRRIENLTNEINKHRGSIIGQLEQQPDGILNFLPAVIAETIVSEP
jgi:cytochrome b subunit of formate dehydrogenase